MALDLAEGYQRHPPRDVAYVSIHSVVDDGSALNALFGHGKEHPCIWKYGIEECGGALRLPHRG